MNNIDNVTLFKVGVRPALREYLLQVWQQRVFVYVLARSRIQAKHQANRLGYLWLILTPLVDAAVYGTVFGMLMGSNKPDNFVQFLLAGVFVFRVFTDCVSTGARSIINSQALVQSLSFPRAVLPLAIALEHFINFIPVLFVLIVLNLLLDGWPSINILWLLPVLSLYALFCTGVVFICARFATHFNDITQIIPFANRFMRYFSGVFYNPLVFIGHIPWLIALFVANPVYAFMELTRWTLIQGYVVSPTVVLSAIAWGLGVFILGFIYFWAGEERYGRVD